MLDQCFFVYWESWLVGQNVNFRPTMVLFAKSATVQQQGLLQISRNSNHLCRHLKLTLPSVVVFSQQL